MATCLPSPTKKTALPIVPTTPTDPNSARGSLAQLAKSEYADMIRDKARDARHGE